jgi:putative radical SAM enzyme (TIGR03279 family)
MPENVTSPPQRAVIGGLVSQVEPGGIAGQLGVLPGDVLLEVNGHPARDVIDVRFYSAEPRLEWRVYRDHQELVFRGDRAAGQELGAEFVHPTFDVDIRRCNNRCEFCFVTQSPRGMRRSLYIKDDDYRYSFLFGHFVTLTNLTDADWQRIEEQHLSPLHVSVHATEPELRRRLLNRTQAPDILEQLRWLAARHIQVHTQLVLMPGLNDGPHLERSLQDMIEVYPAVRSVGVVPVGLTRYSAPQLRSYRPDEARLILDQIKPWRQRCRDELGISWVYPSDEWYLLAGRAVPAAAEYDDFCQTENGVGMVRLFLNDWAGVRRKLARGVQVAAGSDLRRRAATLVCGELAAAVVRRVADQMNARFGCRLQVRPVVNHWYGGGVNVSGLLTGRDVVEQLRVAAGQAVSPLGELVFLPQVMFDNSGQWALDNMSLAQIQDQLGVPVAIAQWPRQVIEAL